MTGPAAVPGFPVGPPVLDSDDVPLPQRRPPWSIDFVRGRSRDGDRPNRRMRPPTGPPEASGRATSPAEVTPSRRETTAPGAAHPHKPVMIELDAGQPSPSIEVAGSAAMESPARPNAESRPGVEKGGESGPEIVLTDFDGSC